MWDGIIGRDVELAESVAGLDIPGHGPWAVVLEGEAGIGKTTVWRAIAARAADRGARVISARTAEAEARLAFGVLADLLGWIDEATLSVLPMPQRRAVEVALLRAEPGEYGVDPRAAAMGTVTALRQLAAERPLVVALDDVQWLDSASADVLSFATRRLLDVPVGFLLTVRTPAEGSLPDLARPLPVDHVRRIKLGPLSVGALYHLFNDRLGHAFPRSTIIRIAAVSGGNPFHALEIARELLADGRLEPGSPMPVPESVRDLARERIRRLPPATRSALLCVAAASRPSTAIIGADALAPAEADGFVEVDLDGRIAFNHPLFAAAVYADAPANERRAVHRRLATVVADLEERARHEALAATGPDPDVAELLAEAGARARARGATASAAELLELSLRLTPADATQDAFRRGVRLADHLHLAGQPHRAQRVLEAAIQRAPPGSERDEASITLGLYCRQTDQDRAVDICEEVLARASSPAMQARAHAMLGLICETMDLRRAATHSAAATALFAELGDRPAWSWAMLAHCWHKLRLGQGADEASFRRARAVQRTVERDSPWRSGVPLLWAVAHDDYGRARANFAAAVGRAREEGNDGDVGLYLAVLAQLDSWRGAIGLADDEAAEALELARLGGSPAAHADALRIRANVDAIRGRIDRVRETLGPEWEAVSTADEGHFTYAVGAVLGFLALSLGDAVEADSQLTRTTEALEAAGMRESPGYRREGDHLEAMLELGHLERADALVHRLEERGQAFPRPWTLAVGARCRGLLLAARGDLDGAMASLDAAVVHHRRLESPYELGRTLLAKAQVHRRRTEKRLAREALAGAVELLEASGAALWAERARQQLGRIRFRAAPTELTEIELQIAELAAAGRTNREIANTVFVSPKTVEARLSSVYGKLGIRSRAELGAWMAGRTANPTVVTAPEAIS